MFFVYVIIQVLTPIHTLENYGAAAYFGPNGHSAYTTNLFFWVKSFKIDNNLKKQIKIGCLWA